MKPRYAYRSAVTGKFVSRQFAEANPTTTVRVLVKRPTTATGEAPGAESQAPSAEKAP